VYAPLKATVNPVGYCIAEHSVHSHVHTRKLFDVAPLWPGWIGTTEENEAFDKEEPLLSRTPQHTLRADDEEVLAAIYRHSYFAFTMVRGGADCMRHLEIMASGSLPLFPDLQDVCRDPYCMSGYPKHLLREVLTLPGIEYAFRSPHNRTYFRFGIRRNMIRAPTIDRLRFDLVRYHSLARQLLEYTQKHLTCGALASYVLKTMSVVDEDPTKAPLLLIVPSFSDYLSMGIEEGFAELGLHYATNLVWGTDPPWTVDARSIDQTADELRAKSVAQCDKKMYSGAYTWCMRVQHPTLGRWKDEDISMAIRNRRFRSIVFTNLFIVDEMVTNVMPFVQDIARYYTPSDVAFVDTRDIPLAPRQYNPIVRSMIQNGSHLFVREMHTLLQMTDD